MRVRRMRAAAAVAALTLALAGCGDDGNGDDNGNADTTPAPSGTTASETQEFEAGTTMARLAEAGSMNVGTKFDQPLFGLQGLGGDPEGFDVEIAKLIGAELGISPDNINWTETPSATREEVIEQGRVDMVVATYTMNEERAKRVTFAGPYYQAGQDLMVAADNEEITGPETLRDAGAKVCSVTGSTPAENILEYIDQANLVLFDVYSKCADALRTGQVDVVTTDNVILLGLVEQSGGSFKLVENPFTEEPYGIGIAKGDVAFCEFIHETLTAAADDGRYAEAWESTAGAVAEQTPSLPELGTCQ
jgi:glutamate transport system substrate-binding protein